MEFLDTLQEYVKRHETNGLIDTSLAGTKLVDLWDNLWKGDDNSEDVSLHILHSPSGAANIALSRHPDYLKNEDR